MRKKLLIICLFLLSIAQVSEAQILYCTPDASFLASGRDGIWPDSATNFNSGIVNVPYVQDITVKVPYDTNSAFGTLIYQHVDVTSVIGLPPGLSITPPTTIVFPGNSVNCVQILGTPTTAGTYTLDFTVKAYLQGLFLPLTQNITYYKIDILPASTGIQQSANYAFEVYQNTPNPASGKTIIKYNVPQDGKAQFKLYNALGKIIYNRRIESKRGENELEINASEYASGIYFVSFEYEGKIITRKMLIN
jgi:hypothetical protein